MALDIEISASPLSAYPGANVVLKATSGVTQPVNVDDFTYGWKIPGGRLRKVNQQTPTNAPTVRSFGAPHPLASARARGEQRGEPRERRPGRSEAAAPAAYRRTVPPSRRVISARAATPRWRPRSSARRRRSSRGGLPHDQ
jgi:hypothetical protein